MKTSFTRRRRGFTLIEIMVVVIVLGILAAVVIPNLTGRTDDARVAKAQADIANLKTALENYKLHMRHYPSEEDGLDVLRNKPSGDDAELWKGPYLTKSVPKDPWGNPYHYYQPAPNGIDGCGVESLGADGQTGGEGYNKDINSWSNYDEKEQ